MKEKESECAGTPGSLRREIWIRPDGGRRVHRTTSAVHDSKHLDSEDEDLATLGCAEVSKFYVCFNTVLSNWRPADRCFFFGPSMALKNRIQ